ncbi:helix-turn-helix domain-containing protein [Paenibacillus sp. GCM10027626]|uniref:helix-turn-helix domain-containing protein n=1 Tax=Paenibacillus sp. GCM10027626 TaxID=3273411 RepID=UPI003632C634
MDIIFLWRNYAMPAIIKVTPRLSEILKERGLTQMWLSQETGVPQGSLSRFDKNDRHVDVHVVAIMTALNITYDELFAIEYSD